MALPARRGARILARRGPSNGWASVEGVKPRGGLERAVGLCCRGLECADLGGTGLGCASPMGWLALRTGMWVFECTRGLEGVVLAAGAEHNPGARERATTGHAVFDGRIFDGLLRRFRSAREDIESKHDEALFGGRHDRGWQDRERHLPHDATDLQGRRGAVG